MCHQNDTIVTVCHNPTWSDYINFAFNLQTLISMRSVSISRLSLVTSSRLLVLIILFMHESVCNGYYPHRSYFFMQSCIYSAAVLKFKCAEARIRYLRFLWGRENKNVHSSFHCQANRLISQGGGACCIFTLEQCGKLNGSLRNRGGVGVYFVS